MKKVWMAAIGGVVVAFANALAVVPNVEFSTVGGYWLFYGGRAAPGVGQFNSFGGANNLSIRVLGAALGGRDETFTNVQVSYSGTYGPFSTVDQTLRSATGPTSLRFQNTQGTVLFTVVFDKATMDWFQVSADTLGWGVRLTPEVTGHPRVERGPLLDGVVPAGVMPSVSFRLDGTRFGPPRDNAGVLEFGRGQVTAQGSAGFRFSCRADLNNDGVVDDADFASFVASYAAMSCPGSFCRADLNDDSIIDDADFARFARAYDSVLCP